MCGTIGPAGETGFSAPFEEEEVPECDATPIGGDVPWRDKTLEPTD